MTEIKFLLPVALIEKIMAMIKSDSKECLYIAPGGNVMVCKRLVHPECGEDYIQLNFEAGIDL